jgi:hypothetical protein
MSEERTAIAMHRWSHENRFHDNNQLSSVEKTEIFLFPDSTAMVINENVNNNRHVNYFGGRNTYEGKWSSQQEGEEPEKFVVEINKKTYQENHAVFAKEEAVNGTIEAVVTPTGLLILKSSFWLCFGILDNEVSHLPPRHIASAKMDCVKIWRHENVFNEEDIVNSREVTEISLHPDHTAVVINENFADDSRKDKQNGAVHYIGGKTTYLGTWHTFVTDDNNFIKHPRHVIYLTEKRYERNHCEDVAEAVSQEDITAMIEVTTDDQNRMRVLNSTVWLSFGELDNQIAHEAPRHLPGNLYLKK